MLPALENVVPPPGRSLAWDTFDLASFPYRWHFHPEHELTLITSGRGRRFVGDSIEPFEKGDLVLLGPHLPHTWHSTPCRGERSRAVVVRFGPDLLGAGFLERAECGRLRRLLVSAGRGLAFSGRAAREIGDTMVGLGAAAPLARLLALPAILDRLAERGIPRPLSSLEWDAAPPSRDAQRIDRACRHIVQHFAEPITLAAVAATARLSPEGFSRFFRRMTGRTFVGWLTEVRIGHACRLLATTDRPVVEIAFASGFGNLSNFNRAFRRLRGRTPREWRQCRGPRAL
ncbi:MAG: AraC family transcriptional regulator [Pirellulales bacterium]